MGVACYIALDSDEPGFDPFLAGKSLARHMEPLDEAAKRLGVTPLMAFFGESSGGVADFLEGEEVDPKSLDLPEEPWFAPAEGLKTARALVAHLEVHPEAFENAEGVLDDLREFEAILTKAEAAGLRWHLAIDF